ncbi:MAG: hypothetical protein ABII25_05215 [bacterium]
MKKLAVCLIMIFILCSRYYAKEIIGSKDAEKIRIEPAQSLTINIKLPYRKYFKVQEIKFELDNIKQDLSEQYVLNTGNGGEDDELLEVIKDKTWVVQEIVSHDLFELSRIGIKMGVPLEDDQELLVCDDSLYEKTRGIIEYDESMKECFVLLDPTVQIQKDEHIFIAVKLAGTPINIKTDAKEKLSACYTDYPDGFKERDPFPEFLRKGLTNNKKSLVYKLYSEKPLDIRPSFQIKVDDSFSSIWTWNGEEKMVLKDKDAMEPINAYFLENRGIFDEREDLILPFVFIPDNSTYPIDLELTSWELEIKTPEDYFSELKYAIEIVFENNEETKTNLITQLYAGWDDFQDESMDDLKETITLFIQSVYLEARQAETKGHVNEIKGILELTEELDSIL